MKVAAILMLLSFANVTSAHEGSLMTVKERLRLLLWTEGLSGPSLKKKSLVPRQPRLPEELERPLRKI
jgi:hypothetical protein